MVPAIFLSAYGVARNKFNFNDAIIMTDIWLTRCDANLPYSLANVINVILKILYHFRLTERMFGRWPLAVIANGLFGGTAVGFG